MVKISGETAKMKYVSIVLCHYSKIDDFNTVAPGPTRSDLLRTSLESILTNTNYPAELIVVDNGGNPDDSDYLLGKAREGKLTHVRFPQNMHFSFAWNIGAKMATGQYLCFICNDIVVAPNWLAECIRMLEEHPGEKIFATPFIDPDKRRFDIILPNGDRSNPRAGSNSLVIRREDFYAIGEWPHRLLSGTKWYNNAEKIGYTSIAPPNNLAEDAGRRRGISLSIRTHIRVPIKKILLDGSEVHFQELKFSDQKI